MLLLLFILRFGVQFFPTGEIRSIDAYYNRAFVLFEDGLVVLNSINNERIFSKPIEDGRLLIYDHEYGDLYILTKTKLFRYLEGSEHLTEFPLGGIRPKRIGVGKGYIYLETGSGYYRLRKGSFNIEKTNEVSATRWQEELNRRNLGQYPILTPYYFTDNLLNKYPITAVREYNRKLWVGSGLGLHMVDIISARKEHIALWPIADVLKITDLDTTIAFISKNQISFYSLAGDSWYYRSYLQDIVDITTYQNRIYLGTKGGLFTVSSGITLPVFRNPIITLTKAGNIIYFYSGSRLLALTPSSTLPIELVTITGNVNRITVFNNQVYIGADRGLYTIDTTGLRDEIIDPRGYFKFGIDDIVTTDGEMLIIANGHLVSYRDSFDYLPINDGSSLALSKDRVWIGTRAGIWFYKDGKVDRWFRLPSTPVYSILEKKGYLWAATEQGLYRVPVY